MRVHFFSAIPDGPWAQALYHDPLPVGGIAVALMLGTSALTGGTVSLPLLVAGFCGTALVYSLDRGATSSPEDTWNHPQRRAWVERHRAWLVGEGLVLVGGAAVAWVQLAWTTRLWTLGLAGAAGIHLLASTRTSPPWTALGVGKPLLIATAWTLGGTLLPIVEAGGPINRAVVLLIGARFLLILPNVLLSDWADRHGDRSADLQPWAAGVDGRALRWVATGLLVGAVICTGGVGWAGAAFWGPAVDALGPVLMGGAVWGADPTKPAHRFLLDAVVAWPAVTALVAWGVA